MSMVTIELLHEDSYDMDGGLVDNNFVARIYTPEINGLALFTAGSFLELRKLVQPSNLLKNVYEKGFLTEDDTNMVLSDIRAYGYEIGNKQYRVWEGGEG